MDPQQEEYFPSQASPPLLLWPLKIKCLKLSIPPTFILPRWRQISSAQSMRHIFPLETLSVYPRKKESARKHSLGACTFSRSWKLSRKWNRCAYTWQRGCKIAPKLNNVHQHPNSLLSLCSDGSEQRHMSNLVASRQHILSSFLVSRKERAWPRALLPPRKLWRLAEPNDRQARSTVELCMQKRGKIFSLASRNYILKVLFSPSLGNVTIP